MTDINYEELYKNKCDRSFSESIKLSHGDYKECIENFKGSKGDVALREIILFVSHLEGFGIECFIDQVEYGASSTCCDTYNRQYMNIHMYNNEGEKFDFNYNMNSMKGLTFDVYMERLTCLIKYKDIYKRMLIIQKISTNE